MANNTAVEIRTNDATDPNNITVTVQGPSEDVPVAHDDEKFRKRTTRLRRQLKWYFYEAFKYKNGTCYFHLLHLVFFLLHVAKVGLITSQMFHFGNDRANFSSVVNRGHLVLRHLMLKGWDASWETLPYPPAHGDFAMYTIDDLVAGINFAVQRYYNVESDSIGFYRRLPTDSLEIKIKYFEFPGLSESTINSGINVIDRTIDVNKGLNTTVDQSGDTTYSYDILKELSHLNISRPIKKMLSTTLLFHMHSVRVLEEVRKARCLRIKGEVMFTDLDNNGQVNVELETLTTRIKCAEMNFSSLPEPALENASEATGGAVIAFSTLSLLASLYSITWGVVAFKQTKSYMARYYKKVYKPVSEDETDLPRSEYFRFLKIWEIFILAGDVLNIYGSAKLFGIQSLNFELSTLDSYTVVLGVGCLLSWFTLLRFFKFHNKFHLLFSTIYRAFGNVVAYMMCVTILFVGFWICGYVVIGPYHVKFSTPTTAMETLFAVVSGDEIFATMAMLESSKTSSNYVFWFTRVYIGIYVAIFTVVVINLLVAIFLSSYESIREYYSQSPKDRDLGPMEKTLRKFLTTEGHERSSLRASICDLMNDSGERTAEESAFRKELLKIVRVNRTPDRVHILMPRTLKAFMEMEEDGIGEIDCRCFKCEIAFIWWRNK